jgi:class 3 adenylate cyclase
VEFATLGGPSRVPRTRYAMNGDVSLAYQVFGEGDVDLLLVSGWVLPMELFWEEPGLARFLERLGSFARVILWDKRGTGLSDRLPPDRLPSLDDRMEDLTAVLDAVGADRPAIFAASEGTALGLLFAATHPERTRALTVFGGWSRSLHADDHPWNPTEEWFDAFIDRVRSSWGDAGDLLELWAPVAADDRLRGWWARALRLGASPTAAVGWLRMTEELDLREVLPSIRVPTLVMHRADDRLVRVENGRYMAERIPGAEYVELPGSDHLWWLGDQDEVLDRIERFLTGTRAPRVPERLLTTVLFTDIADSTRRAGELGDARWRDLLAEHDKLVRDRLAAFQGTEVKTLGDGFLARFDGPTRAIRCAEAIVEAAAALGLRVRAGLHTGECELLDGDLAGIAVSIGARVAALAEPGEVLVSSTVRDLVAGSGIAFADRGEHALHGLDGEWRLLAVVR